MASLWEHGNMEIKCLEQTFIFEIGTLTPSLNPHGINDLKSSIGRLCTEPFNFLKQCAETRHQGIQDNDDEFPPSKSLSVPWT